MSESPSPTAARMERPSDDQDTRRAMNVVRSPKSVIWRHSPVVVESAQMLVVRPVGQCLGQPFPVGGQRRIDDLPDRHTRGWNAREHAKRRVLGSGGPDFEFRRAIHERPLEGVVQRGPMQADHVAQPLGRHRDGRASVNRHLFQHDIRGSPRRHASSSTPSGRLVTTQGRDRGSRCCAGCFHPDRPARRQTSTPGCRARRRTRWRGHRATTPGHPWPRSDRARE